MDYGRAVTFEQYIARKRIADIEGSLRALLEYEPVRDDFGSLQKHEAQYLEAVRIFKSARQLLETGK